MSDPSTTNILLVLLAMAIAVVGVLLAIAIRKQIGLQTEMGKTATDATLAGQMSVLTYQNSALKAAVAELTEEVSALKLRIVTLETEKIGALNNLNGILQKNVKTLEDEIVTLKAAFAVLKEGIGLDAGANVIVVPEASILVQPTPPTPEAPTEGATP